MTKSDNITKLMDDKIWKGGWYQDIEFPDGNRSRSTTFDLEKSESRGLKKWEMIEPYLTKGKFLDIGCNAGLFLVKAQKRYKNLFGMDVSDYFLKQCEFVLGQFKTKAKLYKTDALDFNWHGFPKVDTTIMINALYWIGYSDEEGYRDDYLQKLPEFLNNLSEHTNDLILVGSEEIERFGGTLEDTLPELERYFKIVEAKPVKLNDRELNLIYAKS